MASAGTVTLDLDANSVKMIRELQKAQRQTKRSAGQMRKDMGNALGAMGKAAALFGVAMASAAAVIVKAQAKNIDALAKTSDALGITTESLQTLHTMAELSGVGAEDLDKKLGKMQKNLGEIARKGGIMAEALEDAGLAIKDVISLPADQQFEEVAKALSHIDNQAIRASIASDLFGRDANKLLKLTDELAKTGLAPMRAELEQLGYLISRSEAAGVERMNDSMTVAGKVASGLGQQITVALAPAITAVAEAFIDAAKESGGFKDEVGNIVEGTVKTVGFLIDVVDSIGRTFQIAARLGIIAFEGLKIAIIGAADAIINGPNRAINSMLQMLDAVPGINIDFRFENIANLKQYTDQSEAIIKQALADIDAILLEPLPSSGLEERIKTIRAELAAFKQEMRTGDTGGIGQEETLSPVKVTAKDYDRTELEDWMKARNELQREYQRLIDSTRTASEAHNEELKRIEELYVAGVIPSAEEYYDLLDRTNAKFEETNEKVSEMTEFAVQAARSMQTALADYLFDPFDKGLKGMLKGFLETIRRMVAEAIAAQILKSIFETGSNSSNSGIASFFSAMASSGKAMGGPVNAGRAYLVGERGPEIIIPKSSGNVIPNHQLLATSPSGNITNIVNLPPTVQRQTAAQVAFEVSRIQKRSTSRNA